MKGKKMSDFQPLNIVVITGMSGAGKTVAMQSFEDLNYFCIDNLPPVLLTKFAELLRESNRKLRKIAVVIDMRGREFFSSLVDSLESLQAVKEIQYHVLFLEANDETLVKRYKQTRRRHPLTENGTPLEGIKKERKLLEEIRGRADYIIDTSSLKPSQLKEEIIRVYSQYESSELDVSILSFGFKHGIPIDADLVMDVRFLPNPYYIESMRDLTGLDEEVRNYVIGQEETKRFLEKLEDLLQFLLPQYQREGKSHLVIGIGCTGGQHRSVAIAQKIYQDLNKKNRCRIIHRDLDKKGR